MCFFIDEIYFIGKPWRQGRFKSILEKEHQNFSLQGPSFVCCTWNVYQSAPISRNLTCPQTLLVACLGGSSTSSVLWIITLWRILRIVLLKVATFSSTEVFVKSFLQSNRSSACLISFFPGNVKFGNSRFVDGEFLN